MNGAQVATDDETSANDTVFTFGSVRVSPRQQVTLTLALSATGGKLDTVYLAGPGQAGATVSVSNSCPDGAPSLTRTDTALRAVVRGTSG